MGVVIVFSDHVVEADVLHDGTLATKDASSGSIYFAADVGSSLVIGATGTGTWESVDGGQECFPNGCGRTCCGPRVCPGDGGLCFPRGCWSQAIGCMEPR